LQVLPRVAAWSLLFLIALCFAWELWLAPLRPGGSWLALKAVPLLFAVPGIFRGRRYTYKWLSILVLAYLCEGAVRVSSDHGASRWYAGVELAVALILFVAVVATARLSRRPAPPKTAAPPAQT
jgi:uncharacterized membrane protein